MITFIAMSFVLLFGTLGNAYVIFVFGCNKNSRTSYETLLLILVVVDLCCSIFSPSLFIYGTLTKYKQWHFGEFGCKVIPSIFSLNVSVSQGILIMISIERYRNITNPLRCKVLPQKRLRIFICL